MNEWLAKVQNVDLGYVLNYPVGENSVQDLLVAVLMFFVLVFVFRVLVKRVAGRFEAFARQSENEFDNKLADVIDELKGAFLYFVALYIALGGVEMGVGVEVYVQAFFWFVFFYYGITAVKILADSVLDLVLSHKKKDEETNKTVKFGLRMVINVVLWAGGAMMILSILGVDISGLVASLGIGGVVVALSVQNILGDLFSSLMLYFDRPFEVGDYIVIGEEGGTVKTIGMKTTRIETLKGDELVIPNSKIASGRVHNYKKMKRRRVSFEFGVEYGTSVDRLRKVKAAVKKIIEVNEDLELFAVHFTTFADFSLVFQVIYYVNKPAYLDYLDLQEELNLALKDELKKLGVEMAFPTQTLYIKKTK